MDIMQTNKAIVIRFNLAFIQGGDTTVFDQLISETVINHTAPPGTPNNKAGMFYFLNYILRAGFPDLTVEILDQIAEGDKVTTRKIIRGTHQGEFMGAAPTGKKVEIHVIDIIRLQNGRYQDHWGMSNLAEIIPTLVG